MASQVYIIGATLDEVRECLRHRKGAQDPLAYFSFGHERTALGTLTGQDERLVVASKDGADASYYSNELENRLRELGLNIRVTAVRPKEMA